MDRQEFFRLMWSANVKQKGLLIHIIHHILNGNKEEPLQIFFNGLAGCGKTFVIHVLMDIYNRFTDNDALL